MSASNHSKWMAGLFFVFVFLIAFTLLTNTFLDFKQLIFGEKTPKDVELSGNFLLNEPTQSTGQDERLEFYIPVDQSKAGQPTINQSKWQAVAYALDEKVAKMVDNKLQQMKPSTLPTISLVIHTSVPKSGSTTFAEISQKLSKTNRFTMYLMSKSIPNDIYKDRYLSALDQQRFVQKMMSPTTYSRAMCYGHFYYIDFTKFGYKNPFYISTARDPVDRMISNYYFFRNGDGKFYKPKNPTHLTFDECIAAEATECDLKWILWIQVPFFCGNSFHCVVPSRWALEQAKYNIVNHYMLVGVTEQLGDFMALLEVMLPLHFKGAYRLFTDGKGGVGHARKTLGKHNASEVTLQKIKSSLIYQLEQEFYEFVRDQFDFQKNMTINRIQDDRAYVKSPNYRIGKWTGKAIDYSAA